MAVDLEKIVNLGQRVSVLSQVSQEQNPYTMQNNYINSYLPLALKDKTQAQAAADAIKTQPTSLAQLVPSSLELETEALAKEVVEDQRKVITELKDDRVVSLAWQVGGDKKYLTAERALAQEDYNTLTNFLLDVGGKDNKLWNLILAEAQYNPQSIASAAQVYISKKKQEFVRDNLSKKTREGDKEKVEYDAKTATDYLDAKISELKDNERKSYQIRLGLEYAQAKAKK